MARPTKKQNVLSIKDGTFCFFTINSIEKV